MPAALLLWFICTVVVGVYSDYGRQREWYLASRATISFAAASLAKRLISFNWTAHCFTLLSNTFVDARWKMKISSILSQKKHLRGSLSDYLECTELVLLVLHGLSSVFFSLKLLAFRFKALLISVPLNLFLHDLCHEALCSISDFSIPEPLSILFGSKPRGISLRSWKDFILSEKDLYPAPLSLHFELAGHCRGSLVLSWHITFQSFQLIVMVSDWGLVITTAFKG